MNDQGGIALEPQEQVLRPAIHSEKPPSYDPPLDGEPVDRLAKIGATNQGALDCRTDHPWLEAASKYLDFRKLRHRPIPSGSYRPIAT